MLMSGSSLGRSPSIKGEGERDERPSGSDDLFQIVRSEVPSVRVRLQNLADSRVHDALFNFVQKAHLILSG
jgi:hypothetical protein